MLQSLSVLCIISGMKIDKNEVLRYLKAKPDENTLNLIEKCSKELLQAVKPKTIIKEFTLGHNPLSIEGIPLKGKSIAKFLDGYSTCYLLGATLGIEADTLILKAQATDMARAVVLDACATDLIEKVCDNAVSKRRFSAGYGDLPIEFQSDIFRLLDIERKIGVYLTDAYLLTPTKSVTAIIGGKK